MKKVIGMSSSSRWRIQTVLSTIQIRIRRWYSSKARKVIQRRIWFISGMAKSHLLARKSKMVSLCNLRNTQLRIVKEILVVVESKAVKANGLDQMMERKVLNNKNQQIMIISQMINNKTNYLYINNMLRIEGSTQLARRSRTRVSPRAAPTWL